MTVFIGRDGRHLNCDDARRVVHDSRDDDDDEEREFGEDWSEEERAVARDAVELHRRAEDRRHAARDKRRGKDASEELNDLDREFATEARDTSSSANISTRSGPKDSRARGRDEVDHRNDFNSSSTADSRHGYGFSRNGSADLDTIWVVPERTA